MLGTAELSNCDAHGCSGKLIPAPGKVLKAVRQEHVDGSPRTAVPSHSKSNTGTFSPPNWNSLWFLQLRPDVIKSWLRLRVTVGTAESYFQSHVLSGTYAHQVDGGQSHLHYFNYFPFHFSLFFSFWPVHVIESANAKPTRIQPSPSEIPRSHGSSKLALS